MIHLLQRNLGDYVGADHSLKRPLGMIDLPQHDTCGRAREERALMFSSVETEEVLRCRHGGFQGSTKRVDICCKGEPAVHQQLWCHVGDCAVAFCVDESPIVHAFRDAKVGELNPSGRQS